MLKRENEDDGLVRANSAAELKPTKSRPETAAASVAPPALEPQDVGARTSTSNDTMLLYLAK